MLPAVHSIVDVVRVLHQSACKLPKAEISILNQIYSHFYSLPVKLSDKSFSHFNFSLPTVYVLTLWFQIRGPVVGVVRGALSIASQDHIPGKVVVVTDW